jgi:hypothetical protein
MPERAQEVGMILYRGLDSVAFADIADHVPEIIPRGLPGYVR